MSLSRQLFIIMLLAAGVGGYVYYDRAVAPAGEAAAPEQRASRDDNPIPVDVATVARRPMRRAIEAVGTTKAARSVDIVPLASGRVIELNIPASGNVRAGDILARLDDDIQRADLTEAEANLVEKKQALKRAATLRNRNTVAEATLEQLRAAKATATARVDRARRRLADRTVKAPFDGIVGLTSVDVGARIDDKTVLTTIDDLRDIEIEFTAPETLFGAIAPGMVVEARAAAFADKMFTGRIAAIDNRIDPISRAFKVRARLPNGDHLLPSGMFMFLSITLSRNEVLVAPDEAIIAEGAQNHVFRIIDGQAKRIPIATGERHDGLVEIAKGLGSGDIIVIRGHQRLRDGAAVQIIDNATPDAKNSQAPSAGRPAPSTGRKA